MPPDYPMELFYPGDGYVGGLPTVNRRTAGGVIAGVVRR